MEDFLSMIAGVLEVIFMPKGGKGTKLPEEFRSKDESTQDKLLS
jgi:hypothetical protein